MSRVDPVSMSPNAKPVLLELEEAIHSAEGMSKSIHPRKNPANEPERTHEELKSRTREELVVVRGLLVGAKKRLETA